jgi:transketolase
VIGGLGGAVCEVLSENCPSTVLRIGVNDYFGHSGPATALLHEFGLDAEGIDNKVSSFLK